MRCFFEEKGGRMKRDYLNQDDTGEQQKVTSHKRIFWVLAILFIVGGLLYYAYYSNFLGGNWVLLMFLLCPLMHMFMHNSHGGHGHK